MSTSPIDRVLAVARAELGTVERPAGSNRTKYGAAYGSDGVAWCAMFVWWVFREAGVPLGFKSAYTPTIAGWFRQHAGMWTATPRRGSLALFDFPGDGVNRVSHIGITEAVNRDGSIVSIEGNTSSGAAGSQRDGGGVYRRTRRVGIVGFGHPAYFAAGAQAAPVRPVPPARTVLALGASGDAVRDLQRKLNARGAKLVVDGAFGPATERAVRLYQSSVGLAVDGKAGPNTLGRLG